MVTVSEDRFFHLRGKHVQHAHGRNTGPVEHTGAMIALMPTEEDAQRLRIRGGERPEELHLTLFYLGEATDWSEDQRQSLISALMDQVREDAPGPVTARVFGANHWNGDGDEPCWVLGVGDDRDSDGTRLEEIHRTVTFALEDRHGPEIPAQHTPWSPHICVAYTSDTSLTDELVKRMGPVVFDRIRVAFAGEYTDIDLGGALTAAAPPLRRNPRPSERFTDFVRMQSDWEAAVDAVMRELEPIRQAQFASLAEQVAASAELDDLDALESVSLDAEPVEDVLFAHMVTAAQVAGRAQEREAEEQGVPVPEWELAPVTAAVGRDLLRSVARITARVMNSSLVQSAVRRALDLVGRPQVSPAEVREETLTHLRELSDANPRITVGGAVTAAQNEGRRTVLEAAPPAQFYESSEILDRNVCGPCRQEDGTRFETLADALEQYPSGGFRDCLGGPRCRGTIVAVWNEE